jgi:hypothetical protein
MQTPRLLPLSCLLAATLFALGATAAASTQDERDAAALERAAQPDATPQQFYDSAIREAGGAYKLALEDCKSLKGAEHAACLKEANATYRSDMAEAHKLLKPGKP